MTNQTSEYNISKYDENYDSSKALHSLTMKLQAKAEKERINQLQETRMVRMVFDLKYRRECEMLEDVFKS